MRQLLYHFVFSSHFFSLREILVLSVAAFILLEKQEGVVVQVNRSWVIRDTLERFQTRYTTLEPRGEGYIFVNGGEKTMN